VQVNSGLAINGNYVHAGGLVSKGNSALGKVFRLGAMLNPHDLCVKFCFYSFSRKHQ
jgi:hypothetical protein